MKLIALTICRNSAWVIRAVAGHALTYCDGMVAVCHSCTDGTPDILRDLGATVLEVKGEWKEMVHRQTTLEMGRSLGGTHFVVLDDDEFLANHLTDTFRDIAHRLKPGQVLQQPMANCWRSMDRYRCDVGNPFSCTWKTSVFRDHPDLNWRPDGGYQHHHTHPYGGKLGKNYPLDGGWLHLQHANWKRLVLKQTWYQAMELCRYGKVKANYKGTMDEAGLKVRPVPPHWWDPEFKKLIRLEDPPWQLQDLRRMVKKQGERFFEGEGVKVNAVLKHWK